MSVVFTTVFNGASTSSQSVPISLSLGALFSEARALCQTGDYGSVNFLSSPNSYTSISQDVLKLGVMFAIEGESFAGVLLFRVVLDECEIEHVAIVEHKKRFGIGFALMKHLEHVASSQDVKKIFLEVGVRNLGAQALYEKLGFLPIGKRTLYYHNSEDAIVMEKNL